MTLVAGGRGPVTGRGRADSRQLGTNNSYSGQNGSYRDHEGVLSPSAMSSTPQGRSGRPSFGSISEANSALSSPVAGGGNNNNSSSAAQTTPHRQSKALDYDETLPQEVLGRYEKMRVLGRGSFGAVTLVKDGRDSRLHAMKTLAWGEQSDQKAQAMEEVRLMRILRHPCIVSLSDVFVSADARLVCLTMTYCESGDLGKVRASASYCCAQTINIRVY
jgi:Protein kinase domain